MTNRSAVDFSGWNRNYRIPARLVKSYEDAILTNLTGTYTVDDGETTFQGNTFGSIVSELRWRHKLKIPGLRCDQESMFKALGFEIRRARGRRWYRGGKLGWGQEAEVVTL